MLRRSLKYSNAAPRCSDSSKRRDVAQRELGNVDDVELETRALDAFDLALDDLGFRRDRVHHATRAAARMRRHLEHVDDGVVDVEIDEILHAPAHGGTQLIGGHVGRFDEQQPVTAGIEHADGRCAPVRQPAEDRAKGSCAPSFS